MARADESLNEMEKKVFGADARRHPVIPDCILEQGSGALSAEMQGEIFCQNLARSDPEAAAMWRRRLEIAKR